MARIDDSCSYDGANRAHCVLIRSRNKRAARSAAGLAPKKALSLAAPRCLGDQLNAADARTAAEQHRCRSTGPRARTPPTRRAGGGHHPRKRVRNAADGPTKTQPCSAPSAPAANSRSTSPCTGPRRRSARIPWMTPRLRPWSTRRSGLQKDRRGRSLAWRARRRSFGEGPRERDRTPKIIHHQQGHRDHQLGTLPPEVRGSR